MMLVVIKCEFYWHYFNVVLSFFSLSTLSFLTWWTILPLVCRLSIIAPSFSISRIYLICKNLYSISIHVTFGISKGIKWDLKRNARAKPESHSKHRRPSRHNSSNIRTLYQFIFHQNPLSFISSRARDGRTSSSSISNRNGFNIWNEVHWIEFLPSIASKREIERKAAKLFSCYSFYFPINNE